MRKSEAVRSITAFTLVELMVAVFILSVLLLIAAPSFKPLFNANRSAVSLNNLRYALQFARSSAIKYGVNVKFCGSFDHKTCGNGWQNGQIAVTDNNRLLHVFSPMPSGSELVFKGGLGKQGYVEYTPLGATNGQTGSFYYYYGSDSKAWLWRLIINASGYLRVEKNG